MEDKLDFVLNNNLSRLKKYLNYEISSSVLFFLSFLAPIFMFFAVGAAIIFTPFMMYVLFKEKKTGWLISFIIIVILPIILLLILSVQFEFAAALLTIPIVLFYFYCFLLRFAANEWVRELNFKNQYLHEKIQKEEEAEAFWKQLE
jgi:hypothetical protein